jgi:hypothetical protein
VDKFARDLTPPADARTVNPEGVMTSTKIAGRAALTDRDQMIIKSDPLLARLYEIEALHPELHTPAPAEPKPVSTPALTEAKPVSISSNERKIRAQKIREQAAQERAQAKQFKAVRATQAKQFKAVSY